MIYDADSWLKPYKETIDRRHNAIKDMREYYSRGGSLADGISNHHYYGLHHTDNGDWVLREWAPNASRIYIIGDFNNWRRAEAYSFKPLGGGNWEIVLPKMFLVHGDLYKLLVEWNGGCAERLPSYLTRAVQDPDTKQFCAQVWDVPEPYVWKNAGPGKRRNPLIYECHIGMATEEEKVGTFEEFRQNVLPRIAELGYDTIQIMALQEHPYYGSFGYQIANFFALSSRFGTPEEFKALVDDAHGLGIAVVMDIVHSHSVDNEAEGLSRFDGTDNLYFYDGWQGRHPAWGSRCFNYSKEPVKRFLLSNCKYWMEEYHIDGFRFDGVTSMIYWDHGLGKDFIGYDNYFNQGVDEHALAYLALANILIHEMNPDAITIAEDVSGMAGLAAPLEEGGIGFDFRMSMGVADNWIKWIKTLKDEQWSVGEMWYQLTNKRDDERTVGYAECHDQAMVGDQTIAFRLMDKEMYYCMEKGSSSHIVDRGIALHKMIRLVTAATTGDGYLNFMGNEFGHPEWIDFPREGNGWSYKYARRQWSLADAENLRYGCLECFERDMIRMIRESGMLASRPELILQDEGRKLLIFKRAGNLFIFNFHPYAAARIESVDALKEYRRVVLSSDDQVYNGHDRIKNGDVVSCDNGIELPSRTAMVLGQD